MIKSTSLNELSNHFKSLGLSRGKNVVIHSNLLSFGKILCKVQDLYERIRNILGEKSTIVVPSYTMYLNEQTPFNVKSSLPLAMGSLTKFMMSKNKVSRTYSPTHSHLIDGPLQEKLLNINPYISFGKGSIFEKLHSLDFELILLGCSFQQGATFVHHVEATQGVKYREWIKLKRKIVEKNGNIKNVLISYYARKNNTNFSTDLFYLQDRLTKMGINKSVAIHYGESHSIKLKKLFDYTSVFLKKDPFVLVSNKR